MAALGFSKQKNVRYENSRLNEADFYTCKLKNRFFGVRAVRNQFHRNPFEGDRHRQLSVRENRSVTLEDLKGAIVSEEQALKFVVMLGLVIKNKNVKNRIRRTVWRKKFWQVNLPVWSGRDVQRHCRVVDDQK